MDARRRQWKDVPAVAWLRGLRCQKRSQRRTERGTEDWHQPIIAWLSTILWDSLERLERAGEERTCLVRGEDGRKGGFH